jgi:hypothetical protein
MKDMQTIIREKSVLSGGEYYMDLWRRIFCDILRQISSVELVKIP